MSGFETKAIPSGAAPSACAAPSSSVSYKLPESATATSCEAPNTLAESSTRALRQELEKKLAKLELDTASAQKNVETTKESLAEAQTGILNSRVTLLSGHQKALTEQLGNEQHYATTLEAQTRGYNKTLDLLDQVQKNPNPELIAQLEHQLEKFPLAEQNISRQHIANLQTNNQTLAAVDETYRRQEVVVRTTRNVAIATGAAIATGGVLGGAYLAGTTATMGTAATTATALATGTALGTTAGAIGNTVEATGHIAQGNKTTGQAVRDALSQTASDARTAASGALNAAGGMAAAKGVGIIAGTVGSTTTNAVIQAAANNTAVVRILSGSAAGSAGALTSGVANTAFDVTTGARPLDITEISKDLAFDTTVGLLAGGLGGGAGAIKEGSSALTFGAVTTAEIGGDLAIGYGSAALRAKLEGRELTFDEVTQEVASSILGTTIGEMGGQHGADTAKAIREAQDQTPDTLAPLAVLTLTAARKGADADTHSAPEADAGRLLHPDQREEVSEETTTKLSSTETRQNTDHTLLAEDLKEIKSITGFSAYMLESGKAQLTEEVNGDLRINNFAVLGSETSGTIYRRTADGTVQQCIFNGNETIDNGIFNVSFDALAQQLRKHASLETKLSQEQATESKTDIQRISPTQLQQLHETGEIISTNNKVRYLTDVEAVRVEYVAQRIVELTQQQLTQTDAEKQAFEEAEQITAFYNSVEGRTIAPFPRHRLTTDGARNQPGFEAARPGRIEAGSFLLHEMTHRKQLAEIDPMTLDYNARINAEVDAYVVQAEYLWKNKYQMTFSKTDFSITSRSKESIEKREAPQIDREVIEQFVRANYQLEQSALFAGKEREDYGAAAAKQLQEKQRLFTEVQTLATARGTAGSLSPNDARTEQVALVSRILEHSVADGIELIKKFPLTPVEIIQTLIHQDFTIKHRELVTCLIEQLPSSATNHFLGTGVSILLAKNLEETKRNSNLPKRRQPVSDQAKLLSTEIDDYYAKFLQTKEFRPIAEPISTHSKGEFLAFNNIDTAAYNLHGRYYTDTAKKILHAELVATGSSSDEAAMRLENFANFNGLARITTSSLQWFCKKNSLEWDAVATKLEKARHTSMLYPLEQRLAQKELTKELNESLKDRGGRVALNPQTDHYEVNFDQEPPLLQRTHVTSTPVKLPELGTVLVEETSNGPQLFSLSYGGYSSLNDDPALSSLDLADYGTKNGELFLQDENGTILDGTGKVLWREKNKYLMDVKVIAGKPYLQIANHSLILLDENQNRIGHDYNVREVGEFNGKLTFSVETADGYAIVDAESKTVLQTFPPEHVPSIPIKSGDHIFTFVSRSSHHGSSGLYIDDVFYPETTNDRGTSINNGIVYRQVTDKVDGTSYVTADNRRVSKREYYTFRGKEAFFVNNKLHSYAYDNSGRCHIRNEDGEVFFADSDKFQQRERIYIVGDTFFITEPTSKGIAIHSSDGKEYGTGAYIKNENEISFGAKSISYVDRSKATPELTTIHFEKRPLSEEERVVNQHEQYKINLLNVVHTPTAENIELRTEEIRRQYWRDYPSSFKELSYDSHVAETITAAIKNAPQDFLNSIAARRDQSPAALARELTYLIAPELNITTQPQPSFFNRIAKWFAPGAKAEQVSQQPNPAPADFLKPSDSQMLLGAGIVDDKRPVIECRERETAYLSSDLFGNYNKDTAEWQKHYFPLSTRLSEPVKETTYILPDIGDHPTVILPKSLDATIIRDRVHGINTRGKEIPLATAINALGEVTAEIPNDQKITKVIYSARKSENPEPMRELAAEQYNTFRKAFEKAHGDSMSAPIAVIPEETKVFLNQIKPLPPKEQIIAIQEYSRTLGFYDFNNAKVNREKFGKPLEEQLAIMQQRVSDLKVNKPELAPQLATKQFAGVCADFANLTVAMLREAGFISGVTTGFQPEGKVATVSDAHGSAFVLWPNDHGEYRAIPVDGTPQGSNQTQRNVTLPSIVEREAAIEEQLLAQGEEKQKEIEKMIQAIESQDIAQLRTLENGKLETTLNAMLQTMVKEPHLAILNGILDYYWYTPLHKLTLNTPHNQAHFQEQVSAELPHIRQCISPTDKPAGNALFEMMSKFADRFEQTGIVTNRSAALNTLEQIFDAARHSLNETEAKAAYAIINYLRANRMIGSEVET